MARQAEKDRPAQLPPRLIRSRLTPHPSSLTSPALDRKLRDFFDRHVDRVLADLPDWIHRLLDEVPLHVEDYPAPSILHELGVSRRQLCGLYTGVPLTEKSLDRAQVALPDAVTIYREGILLAAEDDRRQLTEEELLRQIRITILHEIGHHHGLDEDDLAELGYG